MSEKGFVVNEGFETKPKVKKAKKKKGAPALIKGFAALIVIALIVVIFCATVPVCKVQVLETCVITNTDENVQTDYYNDKGLVERKVYTYMGTENGFTVCTYDKHGNILKEESTYQGVFTDVNNYIYTHGKLTRVESKDAAGKLLGCSDMQYNEDGTLAIKISYDQDNNPLAQYNYTYVAGRLVKENVLYLANNYAEEITYTYDGRFMTNEVRKSDRNEKVINYTYDTSGKVLTKNVQNGEYVVYKYGYKIVKVPVFKK